MRISYSLTSAVQIESLSNTTHVGRVARQLLIGDSFTVSMLRWVIQLPVSPWNSGLGQIYFCTKVLVPTILVHSEPSMFGALTATPIEHPCVLRRSIPTESSVLVGADGKRRQPLALYGRPQEQAMSSLGQLIRARTAHGVTIRVRHSTVLYYSYGERCRCLFSPYPHTGTPPVSIQHNRIRNYQEPEAATTCA